MLPKTASLASRDALMILAVAFCVQWSLVSGNFDKDRLVRALTENYVKDVEPSESTVLKLELNLLCARFDKSTGELITSAWEYYAWKDSRFAWEPSEYGGITSLRLPSSLVWTPDVALYNSLSAREERDTKANVVVMKDGSFIWVPRVVYRTQCSADQNGFDCKIVCGSWTYDADFLQLEKHGDGVNVENYFNATCPLLVESASASVVIKRYPCCSEPYASLEIDLRLKERRQEAADENDQDRF